jgi:hypothetical protein
MKVTPRKTNEPLGLDQLPGEIQEICNALLDGLRKALNQNLYGVYLYGAMVFPETRYIVDIDFHVILKRKLTSREKDDVQKLHEKLNEQYPQFKDDLDGYYILVSDAQKTSTPWHQIHPDIPDESWPLHIAHMGAGYCIALCGPEPKSFLPEPTWDELVVSLKSSLNHTLEYIDIHPEYCILNFCRILYSLDTKNVVVSKRRAAEWAQGQFPEWVELITTAIRSFEREGTNEDRAFLQSKIREFHRFLRYRVKEFC